MTTRRTLALLLCTAILCVFASAPTATAAPATPAAGAPAAEGTSPAMPAADTSDLAVHDRALLERMTAEGDAMIAAGKTVPMKALVGQLSRSHADVKLPAGAAGAGAAAAAGKTLSGEEIYDRAARATLVVGGLFKCTKCAHTHCSAASGYIISSSGIAVTNYHVVDSAQNMTIVAMTHDGRIFPVREVLAADKAQDVAIIQLDGSSGKTRGGGAGNKSGAGNTAADVKFDSIPLAAQRPSPGADVFVLSHPDNRFYTFSRGMIARYFHRTAGDGADPTFMQITADYARGSSGGPVLNARGEVVGMVSSTQSVYYSNADQKNPQNLQMVFKDCVPVAAVQGLIGPTEPAAKGK